MKKSAIVVEGGAMRGIFAAGVLDHFIQSDFYDFDFAIGVSAGSTNLIGYLSGDYQRSYRIITEYARREEFMNLRRYLRGGHFCDVNWLWHSSAEELPLTLDSYFKREIPLWVVTTSVETGEPRYYEVNEENLHSLFPASCAMPLVFREFPPIDGEPMTDGGLADSIPVIKAYEDGARDITVVLSQPLNYKKRTNRFPSLMKPFFKEHPKLFEAVTVRTEQYNRARDFILNPPDDCMMRIIAPPEGFPVSRFTQDLDALQEGYKIGAQASRDYLERTLL